ESGRRDRQRIRRLRRSARQDLDVCHLGHGGLASDQLPEGRIAVVRRLYGAHNTPGVDEELRVVGISSTRVSHRELIGTRENELLEVFVGEWSARLTAVPASVERRRAALYDRSSGAEVLDDPRKIFTCANIIIIISKLSDHIHGFGRQVVE